MNGQEGSAQQVGEGGLIFLSSIFFSLPSSRLVDHTGGVGAGQGGVTRWDARERGGPARAALYGLEQDKGGGKKMK